MLQWLWKQKYRVDRGYQLLSLVNLSLLLAQSETLKGFLGVSTSFLVLMGIPLALSLVWSAGYLITRPRSQWAEDRANAEVSQVRRDIDEILRILKG